MKVLIVLARDLNLAVSGRAYEQNLPGQISSRMAKLCFELKQYNRSQSAQMARLAAFNPSG
eukprot:scaffold499455_cov38-Prasinocladus_malaysianus.AAC.1